MLFKKWGGFVPPRTQLGVIQLSLSDLDSLSIQQIICGFNISFDKYFVMSIWKIFTNPSLLTTFLGKRGEISVDVTNATINVHDGTTVGGTALAHKTHTHPNATNSAPGFMGSADFTYLYSHRHPNATESTDGFMSAVDKTKLDGISPNSDGQGGVNLITNGEFETAGTGGNAFAVWTTTTNPAGVWTFSQQSTGGISNLYAQITNTLTSLNSHQFFTGTIESPSLTVAQGDFISISGEWNVSGSAAPTNCISQAFFSLSVRYTDGSFTSLATTVRTADSNGWKPFSAYTQIPITPTKTIAGCFLDLAGQFINNDSITHSFSANAITVDYDSISVFKQSLPINSNNVANTLVFRDSTGSFRSQNIGLDGTLSVTGASTFSTASGTFTGTFTNAVMQTGTYPNPSWISTLSGSKLIAASVPSTALISVNWNQMTGTVPNISIFPNDRNYITNTGNTTGTSGGVLSPGGRETYSPSPGTMPLRDSSGKIQVGNPTVSFDAANKGYVDGQITSITGGAKIYVQSFAPSDPNGIWIDTSIS